ncbi:hypothetical protein G6O69_03885 [Pseudenhygromyxa sp. WMMC2535]|uniref:hypothetical protein n=1 Tax=Pseudenhygromyxa sp. WMMC2535 TaxID=2712867 RepID=UPI001557DB25|nr:hypothetical protein [Pseudenhygromyxa sp. WMMC2535]NVB36956.1 hypothetical protein [Pseudenhygromyxa sp. WMMC2535]
MNIPLNHTFSLLRRAGLGLATVAAISACGFDTDGEFDSGNAMGTEGGADSEGADDIGEDEGQGGSQDGGSADSDGGDGQDGGQDGGSDGGAEGGDGDGDGDGDGGAEGGDGGSGDLYQACSNMDILFVVDTSASMIIEQAKLHAAVGEFVTALGENLPETSFHVAAVGSEDPTLNDTGLDLLPCSGQSGRYTSFTGDDISLSTLAEIQCRVEVGIINFSAERPVQTMLTALSESQQGGLNAGFLRQDADLVVVMIADEDDDLDDNDGTPGAPNIWGASLSLFKEGLMPTTSMISLIGQPEPNACGLLDLDLDLLGLDLLDLDVDLLTASEPGTRLRALAEQYPGVIGDVCQPSYAQFFVTSAAALADICGG